MAADLAAAVLPAPEAAAAVVEVLVVLVEVAEEPVPELEAPVVDEVRLDAAEPLGREQPLASCQNASCGSPFAPPPARQPFSWQLVFEPPSCFTGLCWSIK